MRPAWQNAAAPNEDGVRNVASGHAKRKHMQVCLRWFSEKIRHHTMHPSRPFGLGKQRNGAKGTLLCQRARSCLLPALSRLALNVSDLEIALPERFCAGQRPGAALAYVTIRSPTGLRSAKGDQLVLALRVPLFGRSDLKSLRRSDFARLCAGSSLLKHALLSSSTSCCRSPSSFINCSTLRTECRTVV